MSRYVSFFCLLSCLLLYNVKTSNAFYFESSFFASSEDKYFLHTVERGQTVYSISKMYQVSIEEIYKLNPGSDKGIATGITIKIPQNSGSYIFHTIEPKETLYSVSKNYYMKGEDIIEANPGLTIETFTIGKIIRVPINKVTKPMEGSNESKKQKTTNELLTKENKGENLNAVNVVLLLPFDLKEKDNAKKRRFVEYYEGFLLALDSLKREGYSVNLQVHNITDNKTELANTLKSTTVLNADILIGGFSDDQIKAISSTSRFQNIPYVIPFTSKSDEPQYNPNVFQINTPHSYLYSKVSKMFIEKYKNRNIIFVDNNRTTEKEEFVKYLQTDLTANKISFKKLTYSNSFNSEIKALLNGDSKNIIIPTDATTETFIKITEPIQAINQKQTNRQNILFGFPEWQRMGHEYLDKFFKNNAAIYSVFYTNNTSPDVKNFSNKYKKWYSKNMLDTYPKYGILGFDTGMYFIKALSHFGSGIYSNINKVPYKGIQMDFDFQRVSNWGGFINTNVYFIDFNPDYTISKDSE